MQLPSSIFNLLARYYYHHHEHAPRVFAHYRRFTEHESMSRDELEAIQLRSLKQILRHARDNTAYYHALFDQAGLDPDRVKAPEELSKLPKLTKEIITREFDNLTARNLTPSDYHRSYTGGTRGRKTTFLRDHECRAKRIALQWRSDAWTGWRLPEKVAYIWPAMQDFGCNDEFKQYLVEQFFKRTKLYFAGALSELKCECIHKSLLRYQPGLIRGFPSPLAYFARFLLDRKLRIPDITAVVSTGELLTESQRDMIARAFDAPVFNLYASRETGTIAAECESHDSLHIAIDSVLVQIERSSEWTADSSEGNLLVTDLHNYAMPLIRYEIGDCGALLEGACSCGLPFPLMRGVVGRVADGFWDLEHNFISPIALGNMMELSPRNRLQAQLVQQPNHDILIRLALNSSPDRDTIDCLYSRLKNVFGDRIGISHELVQRIDPEPSGKYRFSICRIPPTDR